MPARLVAGLVAGAAIAAALPPFGWWPLAALGCALLLLAADGLAWSGRLRVGLAGGVGWILPGFWWMTEFSMPGFVAAALLVAACVAVAVTLVMPGRWTALAFPAALVGLEAFRGAWPFGGVPVATLAQTQVGGPVGQVARLGGALGVTAVVATAGVALAAAGRRRWRPAAVAAAVVVAAIAAGLAVDPPPAGRPLSIALVQGGGERGTRAVDTEPGSVFDAHLAASEAVPPGVELTLWPEDVVDVEEGLLGTDEAERLAALAQRLGTTLVVGVVEDVDDDRFRNYAQAWGPDGEPGPAYTKNQRVPFGEWIPFRSTIERLADVSAVPRDATVGRGPGLLGTDAGRLGVVISYEVFFARRARDAVAAGGEVLLVPTNASSYSDAQMPSLELGAARLRAVETGRWVAQAAPTGFTALVDPEGRVHHQTDLGRRQVAVAVIDRRTGDTLYQRLGDGPFVVVAVLALTLAWALSILERPPTPPTRLRTIWRPGSPTVPTRIRRPSVAGPERARTGRAGTGRADPGPGGAADPGVTRGHPR
ncbi:MAG: apolipoprotein N-acyltransferase [Acidimicrobiia bacterium]